MLTAPNTDPVNRLPATKAPLVALLTATTASTAKMEPQGNAPLPVMGFLAGRSVTSETRCGGLCLVSPAATAKMAAAGAAALAALVRTPFGTGPVAAAADAAAAAVRAAAVVVAVAIPSVCSSSTPKSLSYVPPSTLTTAAPRETEETEV